jgi:hypothetical protein
MYILVEDEGAEDDPAYFADPRAEALLAETLESSVRLAKYALVGFVRVKKTTEVDWIENA